MRSGQQQSVIVRPYAPQLGTQQGALTQVKLPIGIIHGKPECLCFPLGFAYVAQINNWQWQRSWWQYDLDEAALPDAEHGPEWLMPPHNFLHALFQCTPV